MATVTAIGLTNTQHWLANLAPRGLASRSLNAGLADYRQELITVIKKKYTTRMSFTAINKLMYSKKSTKGNLNATLFVRYAPHKLSHFQVRQVRITVGNKRLKVGHRKRGLGFKKGRITRQRATSTRVRVRRDHGYRTVNGVKGFKGWLHTGMDNIFERRQQKTWEKGERLPYRPLYGPSISQMARSSLVRKGMQEYGPESHINKIATDDFSSYIAKLR